MSDSRRRGIMRGRLARADNLLTGVDRVVWRSSDGTWAWRAACRALSLWADAEPFVGTERADRHCRRRLETGRTGAAGRRTREHLRGDVQSTGRSGAASPAIHDRL